MYVFFELSFEWLFMVAIFITFIHVYHYTLLPDMMGWVWGICGMICIMHVCTCMLTCM